MTGGARKQLKLGAMIYSIGARAGGWRHPEAAAEAVLDLDFYAGLARTLEGGRFDAIFMADTMALPDQDVGVLRRSEMIKFEPFTLLSALAAVTRNIGLIGTASTTYDDPFHVARRFASLDHLSKGRAGWNAVTTGEVATHRNFGRADHPDHADRYPRASEFVEVVKGLWDSWDDDAFVRDKTTGVYADFDRMHVLNHKADHFSVRGPLNIARPVQGHPVIAQAGQSEAGRELAAQTGELIFCGSSELEAGRAFYADLKGRLARYGRSPDDMVILRQVTPFVGATRAEAQAKYDQALALLDPVVGVDHLSAFAGLDLSRFPIDGPLPELPEVNGIKSVQAKIVALAKTHGYTIRQLTRIALGDVLVGTPEDIADHFQLWRDSDAADGFMITFHHQPGSLDDFVNLAIPQLQSRGLFRREYEGRTLRENLGLTRPPDRSAQAASVAERRGAQ